MLNLNPRICDDTFLIELLASVLCDVVIAEADKFKKFELKRGRSYPFTINFTYLLGTDYDASHANFGFATAALVDVHNVLQNGVTITNETWTPTAPNTSGAANEIQSSVYSATLNVTNDETAFDALLNLLTRGQIRSNPRLMGRIQYNQGVAFT